MTRDELRSYWWIAQPFLIGAAILLAMVWVIASMACVTVPVPHPPAPAPRTTQVRARFVTADGTPSPTDPELLELQFDEGLPSLPCVYDANTGTVACELQPSTPIPFGAHLDAQFPTFQPVTLDVTLKADPDFATWQLVPGPNAVPDIGNPRPTVLVPVNPHVDPSTIPLGELARIRGAMWPRVSVCPITPLLPFGPRPGRPDNIIGTPYFDNYSPEQQTAILECLRAAGYTNVVTGGIVDTWAYHGLWHAHDYSSDDSFERWLDIHQQFWDAGLRPVTFIHVDGESYEQTEARLTGLVARHPRAQSLIRIVIMSGWEPAKYEWSSCTWAKYVALGKRLFPNALQGVHTVSDVDAPVGTDSLCNDNGQPNGRGWARLADAGVHLWFIQNGPYSGAPADDPTLAGNFAAQFQNNAAGAAAHGVAWHFWNRIDSWPNWSGFGPGIPICPVAAEHTAYEATWNNRPSEPARNAWGDLAVTAPGSDSCGYLDGGTVDVPRRR